MWEFILFDVLLGAICFVGAVLWVRVVFQIFWGAPSYSLKRSHSFTYPMRLLRQALFVLCFLVIFGFSLVHRIYLHSQKDFDPSTTPYWFVLAHVVLTGSQGVFNFIMFGLRKQNGLLWGKSFESLVQKIRELLGYERDVPLMDGYSLNI